MSLTEAEARVCRATGITPEQFTATRRAADFLAEKLRAQKEEGHFNDRRGSVCARQRGSK